jgi:hypothetical protein
MASRTSLAMTTPSIRSGNRSSQATRPEPGPVERAENRRGQRPGAGAELVHRRRLPAASGGPWSGARRRDRARPWSGGRPTGFEPGCDLAPDHGPEQRRQLGRGDEVASGAEDRMRARVVAQSRLVQCQAHVAIERNPAARGVDGSGDPATERRGDCRVGAGGKCPFAFAPVVAPLHADLPCHRPAGPGRHAKLNG